MHTNTDSEPAPASASTTHRDLYKEVTNRIIAMIEKEVAPWRMTWSTYGLARNYTTGHVYTGINMILMNNTVHPIPYFMTYNQVQAQNGRIRKGAKGEMVIFFNVYYKDSLDKTLSKEEALERSARGEEIHVVRFIKPYYVFNVADVEGIDFTFKEVNLRPNEKIQWCENIFENMPNRPEVKSIDANQAFYSPRLDFVNMPAIEQFESAEAYYATFFHELVHATGHASRLARDEVIHPQKFKSKPYSREEMLAELGASFLCSIAGIDYDSIAENNAAYLAGWLTVLKEDSKFIFKVAAEAQKAVDYILRRRQGEGD